MVFSRPTVAGARLRPLIGLTLADLATPMALQSDTTRLIGYFPKRRSSLPDWLDGSQAEEICSVSECIVAGPHNWVELWLHNDFGLFDTVEIAENAARSDSASFDIYAYRILPKVFAQDGVAHLSLPAVPTGDIPGDFLPLGYDVVSKSSSDFFECSPLSCNAMALEIPVNRYCLLDDLRYACEVAERFATEEPEPGPFYVVEVLRLSDHT